MLSLDTYSILTRQTMVEFLIYCVLSPLHIVSCWVDGSKQFDWFFLFVLTEPAEPHLRRPLKKVQIILLMFFFICSNRTPFKKASQKDVCMALNFVKVFEQNLGLGLVCVAGACLPALHYPRWTWSEPWA